jgi:sec-independent protein translocase protein TatC
LLDWQPQSALTHKIKQSLGMVSVASRVNPACEPRCVPTLDTASIVGSRPTKSPAAKQNLRRWADILVPFVTTHAAGVSGAIVLRCGTTPAACCACRAIVGWELIRHPRGIRRAPAGLPGAPMATHEYDEDLFAETRMSFGDHLEELRTCLIRALLGLALGVVISFFFGWYVVDLIKSPVENALIRHYVKFYEQNPEARNKLLEEFRRRLEEEPNEVLQALNEPRPIRFRLSAKEIDERMRMLYPQLFAGVEPPKADAEPVALSGMVRPLDVIYELESALSVLVRRTTPTTLAAPEMFFVYFKVCLITGFVLSSPWVFFQIWKFIAAGLYPHEKRYVYASLGPAVFLFLGGVVLCQFVIIPKALGALLDFNLWLNVEPDFRLNEWLSFAILLPVVTGLCFQTPLVMFVLAKIGIFTAEDYAAKRRMAIFIMLIFTAVITPTVDYFSLLAVWLPMVALYEVGIWIVRWKVKSEAPEDYDEVPYQPEPATAKSASVDGYRD